MYSAVLTITAKDLRQRVRDSALLVFAIALPLGMAFLFDLVLGGDGPQFSARYAVVDQDGGEVAARFREQALTPLQNSGRVSVKTLSTLDEATRLVDDKEIDAVFVLPAGLSAAVAEGRAATLSIVGNVDAALAVQVAREVGQSFATGRQADALAVAVVLDGRPATPDEQAELAARAAAVGDPLALVADDSVSRRELDTTTYYSAGMAVFFLFFAGLFMVTGLLDERRGGTLARLLAAPIRPQAIVLGKMLSAVLVGLASMTVLVVATTLLFGARWGDWRGVAPLLVASVLAATGVMAAIAAFAKTPEQASNWQSVVAMLLGVFGGALFPLAQLGQLAGFSYLTPHRWLLQGLADLAGGGSAQAVAASVAALLAFAAAGLAVALVRAGRLVRA